MIRRDFLTLAASAAGLAVFSAPALAQDIVLTVSGDIEGGERTFTDADLLALPQVSFDTGTNWTEGELTFSGPSLATVLEAVGAGPGDISLAAINDYVVSMPRSVVEASVPIIANRIDGAPFSRRDKGPLWIVFPYDSDERFRSETVFAYSVWQLARISVL